MTIPDPAPSGRRWVALLTLGTGLPPSVSAARLAQGVAIAGCRHVRGHHSGALILDCEPTVDAEQLRDALTSAVVHPGGAVLAALLLGHDELARIVADCPFTPSARQEVVVVIGQPGRRPDHLGIEGPRRSAETAASLFQQLAVSGRALYWQRFTDGPIDRAFPLLARSQDEGRTVIRPLQQLVHLLADLDRG